MNHRAALLVQTPLFELGTIPPISGEWVLLSLGELRVWSLDHQQGHGLGDS